MIMRLYIVGAALLYFWLWGHFSNWDPHQMVFDDCCFYLGPFLNWKAAALLRLGFGFVVFMAALLSVWTIEKGK